MIWAIIPAWLKHAVAWVVMGLTAVLGAWLAGRQSGKQTAKNKAATKRAEDLLITKNVRDENAKLSDDAVRKSLSKWVRPDK